MFFVYVDYVLEDVLKPFYAGKGNEDRVNLVKRNHRHTPEHKQKISGGLNCRKQEVV